MKSTSIVLAGLLMAGSALLTSGPSMAQTPPGHPGGAHGHPGFHGAPRFRFEHRDFGHFSPFEHQTWIGGRWDHGWHNGRYGWWWFAGGAWYFYTDPIYPYPGYVSDYYAAEDAYGPGRNWYYCNDPPGYYPYIRACRMPWQPVPAGAPTAPGYGPPPDADQNGPPDDQPPPNYQGPGDQPPPGDQGPSYGPGYPPPGDQGPSDGPGYPPPPGSNPPPDGYNGPNGNGPN